MKNLLPSVKLRQFSSADGAVVDLEFTPDPGHAGRGAVLSSDSCY